MDTRFWGPSGWRLLHLITFATSDIDNDHLQLFFRNLPYVLPCKFCRASLTDYYAVDPIPSNKVEFPEPPLDKKYKSLSISRYYLYGWGRHDKK